MQALKIRRILMLTAALVLLPAAALVQAESEVEVALLERTQELFALAQHWQHTEPRALYLNGARVIVATGSSEQPLSVMLDHFQAHCRAESGGLHELARVRAARAQGRLPSLIDGVLRVEEEKRGLVACLTRGQAAWSADGWRRALVAFGETGDLAQWGGLRVVQLQARGDGSFFVAAWNDGPLPIWKMFPEQGDSPGADPVGVPRPKRAQRVLSVWQEGQPNALHVYRSDTSQEELFAEYVSSFEGAGWKLQDASSLLGGAALHGGLFAQGAKGVVVEVEGDEAGSLVSVLPMELRRAREVHVPRF